MDKLPKKINILFADQSINEGGGGQSLFYLVKFLNRDFFNVHVLLPSEKGLLGNRLEKETLSHIHYEDRLHIKTKFKYAFDFIYLTFIKLPAIIRKNQIDIIYCNNTTTRIIGALSGLITHRIVIWHVRNIPSGFSRFIQKKISSLSTVHKIICLSESHYKLMPFPGSKTVIINNGIDTQEFSPLSIKEKKLKTEYGLSNASIIIGVTGRLLSKKGYDYFIRSGFNVLKMLPDHQIFFIIMGGTQTKKQKEYEKRLKSLVEELNIRSSVIFTGFKTNVKSYLADFDILVVPSIWEEPFGRTTIEAMALGLPVVGFRTGATPEIVVEQKTGLLVDKEDIDGLSRALITLIENPTMRHGMGLSGRQRVTDKYDIIQKTQEIEEIILQLVTRKI